MAKRAEKGTMGSFSRGAELWMHQARLFAVAVLTVVVISFLIGLVTGSVYFYKAASPVERYALERNWIGQARDALGMNRAKMEIYVNGNKSMLDVKEVIALTEDDATEARRKMRNGTLIGSLVGIGCLILLSMFWWHYGRGKMTDERLRGASLVTGEDLTALVNAREDASPYVIADVPMRAKSENLHTLIAGAQGTGKSQQFFALMKQVRARGKRAIVYDPSGEFTQAFFRPGKDILMNPLDARSPNWNIWNEIEKDYHFDNMANGLIPDPAEADPFWAKAGRMVLKDVYKVLGREGRRTNQDLYNSIAKSNLEAMHALLAGEAGATYVDPVTERTGMSLKMTVQNQLEAFRFLHDEGEPFSIRKWIKEESDSWMFITAREELREALAPVLSLWVDTVIKAVLSLDPVHRERLWLFVDELPTLQKLDILKLALTNTRKYGLCCVLGVQDFSQVYEIYGHDLAKTIISGCQTKLLLRVTDGAAAKLMSELMGQAEVDEKDETLSYGISSSRDGVSVFAKRNLREIVLTSEILTLPDMHGYLVIPGDYPIARVAYQYTPTPKIADGFVERGGLGISFHPATPAATDMLDDDDDAPSAPTADGGKKADSGRVVIDVDTGEVVGTREEISRAKPRSEDASDLEALAEALAGKEDISKDRTYTFAVPPKGFPSRMFHDAGMEIPGFIHVPAGKTLMQSIEALTMKKPVKAAAAAAKPAPKKPDPYADI
ncbi:MULTISPECIES: type IV secretion system DNA-binding domain-containing protein [Burkholderiales]|uniref:type IV secretion system DNA-binding domain-containing protein n=1 Tax=Burkholderiales TaxID=80840 RepID=UPI00301769E8